MAPQQEQSSLNITDEKPSNLSVCTNAKHELFLKPGDRPEPGPGQCLVHVRVTGICGSDVHFWKDGRIGDQIIKDDLGLGHESAGVVIAVGKDVINFQPGRRPLPSTGTDCELGHEQYTAQTRRTSKAEENCVRSRRPGNHRSRRTLWSADL